MQQAGAQVTFYLYAMSLLTDKPVVVRKNIHVEPRNEMLPWPEALAGA